MNMFTKSLKLTKKRAAAMLLLLGICLAAAVVLCSSPRSLLSTGDMLDASQPKGRVKYLASYGWEIDPESEEERTVLLPKDLKGAVGEYADMQTGQGYDFAAYAGLECRQFTYAVTNYGGCTGTVYAVLYVKGTRVIGGDIHSAEINGFMHGIR